MAWRMQKYVCLHVFNAKMRLSGQSLLCHIGMLAAANAKTLYTTHNQKRAIHFTIDFWNHAIWRQC